MLLLLLVTMAFRVISTRGARVMRRRMLLLGMLRMLLLLVLLTMLLLAVTVRLLLLVLL